MLLLVWKSDEKLMMVSPAELPVGSFLFILTSISPPSASAADVKSSLLPSTCRTDLHRNLSKPPVSPQVSALNPSDSPSHGRPPALSTHLDLLANVSWFENQRSFTVLVIWASVCWAVFCPVVHIKGVLAQAPWGAEWTQINSENLFRCFNSGGRSTSFDKTIAEGKWRDIWRRGNRGRDVGTVSLQRPTFCPAQNAPAEINMEDFWYCYRKHQQKGLKSNIWSW